jgi:predicted 2-oxoglutarate/Fe(II)-dependent dioxygenase YbiX
MNEAPSLIVILEYSIGQHAGRSLAAAAAASNEQALRPRASLVPDDIPPAAGDSHGHIRTDILPRPASRGYVRGSHLSNEQTLPPFQIVATATGLLSDTEMDRLIAEHGPRMAQARLGTGGRNPEVRRSQTVFLGKEEKNRWLYERIWYAARELNERYFCVDISGIEDDIQLARYDSSDSGFYTWHTDFADLAPRRKLSISVQLSRPEDYDGGDLELLFYSRPYQTEKSKGALIVFPSFALHRVTPVTRGTRWSLVAWISGARWR